MNKIQILLVSVLIIFTVCCQPSDSKEGKSSQENKLKKEIVQVKKPIEINNDNFLAENRKKEGVITTKTGLQYTIIKEGTGRRPKANDKVKVHYSGRLVNGNEFDSSYKRGRPATFGVNQVIKGWTEALQLMKVGAKYKLFIPSGLAYGPRGAGQKIGPNAVLIFEVELLDIIE